MNSSIDATNKGAFRAVLNFASFCNFGSDIDGCKLPLSLPHEWLAEFKKKYIVETE